jgi:hypothetical protein
MCVTKESGGFKRPTPRWCGEFNKIALSALLGAIATVLVSGFGAFLAKIYNPDGVAHLFNAVTQSDIKTTQSDIKTLQERVTELENRLNNLLDSHSRIRIINADEGGSLTWNILRIRSFWKTA